MIALASSCRAAGAADLSRRLAERGPATLLVGTLFTLVSPPSLALAAFRGQSLRGSGCRFAHGLVMLGASAVVVPAGVVLAPLHPARLPAAWFDGVVDAFQEDYCTHPLSSVLP